MSIEEIYGVLSLSMKFYLCLWSSIFVYGVLSLSTEFYLCLWSSIFVCGCWVHVYGNGWVHVCGCLGTCMRKLGAKYAETFGCMYAVVGCKSMEQLGACLTVGSLPDSR